MKSWLNCLGLEGGLPSRDRDFATGKRATLSLLLWFPKNLALLGSTPDTTLGPSLFAVVQLLL